MSSGKPATNPIWKLGYQHSEQEKREYHLTYAIAPCQQKCLKIHRPVVQFLFLLFCFNPYKIYFLLLTNTAHVAGNFLLNRKERFTRQGQEF